jgi:excisionase family DNA binding protein
MATMQAETPQVDGYVRPGTAAELTGWSRWTIHKAIQSGGLAAVAVDDRLHVHGDDLEAWAAGKRRRG